MARYRHCSAVVAAMSHRERGFALLIVLWTVGFLALLGTQIVAAGRLNTQLADNLKQDAVLEAAADGAIPHVVFLLLAARNPDFQADGLVRQVRVGQTTVLVRVENESDRINLNTASGALLTALIEEVGESPALATRVGAAILDWRTSGANPRAGGAKGPAYQAAGRAYGPPGTAFQSVGEVADVLGMTPELFTRLAPHLTVLTDSDPDLSTRDLVVARALADAAGVADAATNTQPITEQVLRITATAVGKALARASITVVASADFQNTVPHVNILLRERGVPVTNGAMVNAVVR